MTATPLGIAALATAIGSVAIQLIASPVEVSLQIQGGTSFARAVLVSALVTAVVALVGLILGIVAVRRDGARALPCAAIGVAGYVLVGQVVGIGGALVGALISRLF